MPLKVGSLVNSLHKIKYEHCTKKKNTIHQVTTMLATDTDDPSLKITTLASVRAIIKVSGH